MNCIESMSLEARELFLESRVPELAKPPSSLTFLRDYVSKNVPLVIRGGCSEWPACKKWNHSYFRQKIGNKKVTVAITPNGYADAVYENDKFTLPDEKSMQFNEFLNALESHKDKKFDDEDDGDDGDGGGRDRTQHGNRKRHQRSKNYKGIYYIQKQNSCLTTEYQELQDDVDESIMWAEEAFVHKDHYENIYCVVEGCKTFILLPPTDQPFIHYDIYPVMKFKMKEKSKNDDDDGDDDDGDGDDEEEEDDGDDDDGDGDDDDSIFTLEKEAGDNNMVRWTPIDPVNPDLELYPNYAKARPIEVKVQKGDMLYLPSLWFHHVRQSHGCIAVNYWYDMNYDIKYCYFKFLESLIGVVKGDDDDDGGSDDDDDEKGGMKHLQ